MPSKILIVNEHADFFWLDRGHLAALIAFLQRRSGFADESALRSLARVVTFPFLFVYLAIYAASVHAARAVRRMLGLGHHAERW
jgi:hypothetical protein